VIKGDASGRTCRSGWRNQSNCRSCLSSLQSAHRDCTLPRNEWWCPWKPCELVGCRPVVVRSGEAVAAKAIARLQLAPPRTWRWALHLIQWPRLLVSLLALSPSLACLTIPSNASSSFNSAALSRRTSKLPSSSLISVSCACHVGARLKTPKPNGVH
jgi:hypothetical protein